MSDVPSHKPRAPDWRKALQDSNAALAAGKTTAPGLADDPVLEVYTTPCTHPGCGRKVVWMRFADRTEGECEGKWLHH